MLTQKEIKIIPSSADLSQTTIECDFHYLLKNNSKQEFIQELHKISEGIATGYKIGEIDLKIPGGAISILAGPTSHGKTATMINLVLGALNNHNDKSAYFFTYEESAASILSLFLNTWINKDLAKNNREFIASYFHDRQASYLDSESYDYFTHAQELFFKEIVDSGRLKVFYPNMSVEELVAAIRFIKENTNVGLVCIDYMQLLTLEGKHSNRQEELKRICLMLRDCAVETGLPILLAAQFNRDVKCEADLSPIHIREAGDIEQIAHLIIGMWNRNFIFAKEGNIDKNGKIVDKESTIYLEVLKGRSIGNNHWTVLDFNGNTGKLGNLDLLLEELEGTENSEDDAFDPFYDELSKY